MSQDKSFEISWDGVLPVTPQEVWDAITARTGGWLWEIDYEPRAGGVERGLNPGGGQVIVWDPPRRLVTRSTSGTFNELDHHLERCAVGTYLRYSQRTEAPDNFEVEVDACRNHTDFYFHTLGEYLRHFPGRDATYVHVSAPDRAVGIDFALVLEALGLGEAMLGDEVQLRPRGIAPIDGVVDYVAPAFVGVRTADALYRLFGRDRWGWPVGIAVHSFSPAAKADALEQFWSGWLAGLANPEGSGPSQMS